MGFDLAMLLLRRASGIERSSCAGAHAVKCHITRCATHTDSKERNMKRMAILASLAAVGAISASAPVWGAADPAMIAARQKIFGIENVDATSGEVRKDKVVFSWLGHIAGAVSFEGRVILLDTFVARIEVTPGRTPYVIKDLVDLDAEAAFISHGHGDHADNAAFLAAKTGMTLYMSPEARATAQNALNRMKNA